MKNLSIFSSKLFFFIKASLRKAREGICSCIGLVLLIIYLKMIPEELLGPTNLSGAQALYIYKPTKGIMIN